MELAAIGGMGLVPAPAHHALAHMQLPQGAADHRQGAAARQFKHHIAAVAVFKNNVLNGPFQLVQLLFFMGRRPPFPLQLSIIYKYTLPGEFL